MHSLQKYEVEPTNRQKSAVAIIHRTSRTGSYVCQKAEPHQSTLQSDLCGVMINNIGSMHTVIPGILILVLIIIYMFVFKQLTFFFV